VAAVEDEAYVPGLGAQLHQACIDLFVGNVPVLMGVSPTVPRYYCLIIIVRINAVGVEPLGAMTAKVDHHNITLLGVDNQVIHS
jgi:hypothetical protein